MLDIGKRLLAVMACAVACNASAVVIEDDAVIEPNPFIPGHQWLTLTQSIPPGQGLFAIDIAYLGGSNFQFSYFAIAEEYGLFAVSNGETFDPGFASCHIPLVSNNGHDPGSAIIGFAPAASLYFGYWDDRNFNSMPDASDNYGWVRITRSGSELVASSGATAIGGGIIVGTTIQIPEPAPTILAGFGAILILLFARGLKRSMEPGGESNR